MSEKHLDDAGLDHFLAHATQPKPKRGFEQRLLARIADVQVAKIIAFPVCKKTSPWLVGLPLAASLAIGLWMGTTDLSSYVPNYSSSMMSDNTIAPNPQASKI